MGIQKNIEEIKLIFKNWNQSLTSEEKELLYEYSKFLYEEVNTFLRDEILDSDDFGNSPDDLRIKENIDKIDNILNRFVLEEEILIYRNEHHNISIEEMYEYISGINRIEYKSFVSTSFTKESSKDFLDTLKRRYPNESFLCIEGDLKKGVSCGYLDEEISATGEQEKEILIGRNAIFRINKKLTIINNKEKIINIYGEFVRE